MRLLVIGTALSIFSGVASAEEASSTPLQQAISGYDSAVEGIESHLSERFSSYAEDRRRRLLNDPLDRYAFHIAQFDEVEKGEPKLIAERFQLILDFANWPSRDGYGDPPLDEFGNKPDPIEVFYKSGAQTPERRALARLLCEPVAEREAAAAKAAPLTASRSKLKKSSKPSGLSGMALLAHAATANYNVPVSNEAQSKAQTNEVYFAVLKTCSQDLETAELPFLNLASGGAGAPESLGAVIAGGNAILGLLNALDSALGGLGKMIENRRIDTAIINYIKQLEPLPDYPGISPAIKKATEEAANKVGAANVTAKDPARPGEATVPQPSKENYVRNSIKQIRSDLDELNRVQRVYAARTYYVEFLKYADIRNRVIPGEGVSISNVEGAPAVILTKESILVRKGQTSSKRYEAINSFIDEQGVPAQTDALLQAANAYDLAYRGVDASGSIAGVEKAWTSLVKYAYEPKSFRGELAAAIGLLEQVQAASDGVKKAFTDFDAAIEEIKKSEKERREKKKKKEEAAPEE